jgi:methylmalonyl-CoA/ethylmalonyl-CoA epimerase
MMPGKPPIPVTGCDHIALAVPDLEATIALFRDQFGVTVGPTKDVPEQGMRLAYAELGNLRLELMEPTSPESPLTGFLAKRPAGGLHHICLTTADPQAAFENATEAGLTPISPRVQRGHHGRALFFLNPKHTHGTLIEIEDEGQEP